MQKIFHFPIGEYRFDSVLGIIEVSGDGADGHIVSGLSGHLEFLHITDPVPGVKDHDLSILHSGKSGQCCLAGITAGGYEDDRLPAGIELFQGGGQ